MWESIKGFLTRKIWADFTPAVLLVLALTSTLIVKLYQKLIKS